MSLFLGSVGNGYAKNLFVLLQILENFRNFLNSWPTNGQSRVHNYIWKISPSILLWKIWKERNKIRFMNESIKVSSFPNKVEASIKK